MTHLEHIHTLIEEDKDSLVSSYLSLLAFLRTHQNNEHIQRTEFLNEITNVVGEHIEKLPENSIPVFNELTGNELKRIDSLLNDVHGDKRD